MKEKIKIYSAADFASYHAGTMPVNEMNKLEKAALEDTLLADALEGYQYTSSAESDIKELHDRLRNNVEKKKTFSLFPFSGNGWLQIAALFIVVAGAGYFFYILNNNKKENALALNEIKTPSLKKDTAALLKNDTVTNNDVAFENQRASTLEQKDKAVLSAPSSQLKTEIPVINESAKPAPASAYLDKSKDESYSDRDFKAEAKDGSASEAKEYVLKGKITDDNGVGIPYASVKIKKQNIAVTADTSGSFTLKSKDSSITAMAAALGYEPKSFTLEKDEQPTVQINRNGAELSSVVVTSATQSRKRKPVNASSRELEGRATDTQISQATPYPSGGQEKFDNYIKEKGATLFDENGDRLEGEVLLSFSLNKKNKPDYVKVIKSSCEACEEKAIDLLQNGPEWIGIKNQKGTVLIKF